MRRLVRHAVISLIAASLAGCAAQSPTSDARAQLKLATIELANGSPGAALANTQQVLQSAPRDRDAWIISGDAQSAEGQPDLAQVSYARALSADAGSVAAALGLARLRLAHDPAQAAADLAKLAQRHPHDARIWTDLGVAYDLQYRSADAQGAYRRAMQEEPLLQSPRVDLGLSLALSGHPSEAAGLLKPLAASPQANARLRHNYAVAATLAGDLRAAHGLLDADLPAEQVASALESYAAFRDPPPR